MLNDYESEIGSLLTTIGDTSLVADELLKRWHRGALSWFDQEKVGSFLIHAGLFPSLISHLEKNLESSHRFPWATMAGLLQKLRPQLSKQEWDFFFVGASEEESLTEFCSCLTLEGLEPRFGKIRRNLQQEILQKGVSHRDQLLYSLQDAAKSSSPLSLEKVVTQLTLMFPEDAEVLQAVRFAKDRQAEELLQKKLGEDPMSVLERKAFEIDKDQQENMRSFAQQLKNAARKSSLKKYDAAVALYQMGMNEEALKMLTGKKPTHAEKWLRLELLAETRRFVELLEAADELEGSLGDDPSHAVSISYARARALGGLNQTAAAVRILSEIVQTHPGYRSSEALLRQLKGNSSL